MIVQDGAEDGFGGAVAGADLGPMEKVADPQVIDVIHFVGLADVGALFPGNPALVLEQAQKGIVVNGGLAQQPLIPELFKMFLRREVGVGF